MTSGQQDGSSTNKSPWTEVQRTKVRGRKSDESWTDIWRKLDRSWTKVPRTSHFRWISNESWTDVGGRSTKVGQKSDKSWTEVQQTSDESPTYVERVELSRHYGDGGRRCYTAAPRNVATMVRNAVARNIIAALAGNALQLAAFLWRYCNNALDFAMLFQWPATRRYYNNVTRRCCGNVLELATVLRWPTTRWTS